MPNTLAHVGVQVAISRALWRDAELRWISLGCVIPDLPWIAQRAITTLLPQIDPYEMRFYAVAQASLAVSLVACAGFALLSRRPRHVFLLLSVNAVLHLLLDALQTKWANGVHLFAPFSWTIWNAGWFWPESPWTWILTALGLGAFAWLWRERPPVQVAPAPAIRRQRVLAVVTLGVVYMAAPLVLRAGPEEADSHFARTLRDREVRAGRAVEFDREGLVVTDAGTFVRTLSGERIALVGAPVSGQPISIRGVFAARDQVRVSDWHDHSSWPRSAASYFGLALTLACWVRFWISGWRDAGGGVGR